MSRRPILKATLPKPLAIISGIALVASTQYILENEKASRCKAANDNISKANFVDTPPLPKKDPPKSRSRIPWPPDYVDSHNQARYLIQKELYERSLSHPPPASPLDPPPREDRTCTDRRWAQLMDGTITHRETTLVEDWRTGMLHVEDRMWDTTRSGVLRFHNVTKRFPPIQKGDIVQGQESGVYCDRKAGDEDAKCYRRHFWNFVADTASWKVQKSKHSDKPLPGWRADKDLNGEELVRVASNMPKLPAGFRVPPVMKVDPKPTVDIEEGQ
ncbi:hypothetical protein MPH_03206 [Macrophomina phaseolina MS6]|uniref:Uncharacterized protein n=1 Tax=Macrophomina phaseolina (strain MS6) TaxID=1126212 RepID=K2RX44_MACPH|nr:hypothetical protein MPH_03206 [Macrophomina phaseolina MS6]